MDSTLFALVRRVWARELVRNAYCGLLAREPDEEGLRAYVQRLRQAAPYSEVLAEITKSDEHWELQLQSRADWVIAAAYRALLRREPSPSEWSASRQQLAAHGDTEALLSDLSDSPELWAAQLSRHSDELVAAAFRALVGREPKPAELSDFADGAPSWTGAFEGIARSMPLWEAQLKSRAAELVGDAYGALLQREADSEGLTTYSSQLATDGDFGKMLSALASSPEAWDVQLRLRSERIAAVVFRALVGRDPVDEELQDYGQRLAQGRGLGELVAAIASSHDGWTHQVQAKADELVRSGFEGLLGRMPEPAELKTCVQHLSNEEGLSQLLKHIDSSDEHWKQQLHRRNGEVLDAVYQGILRRPIDTGALAHYGPRFESVESLRAIVSEVANSHERREMVRCEERNSPARAESDLALLAEHVDRVFLKRVGRSAERSELAACLAGGKHIGQALPKVIQAAFESQGRTAASDRKIKKVLLFGAFGNGNMGDTYQAMSVRHHLLESWGISDDSLFACSLLDTADYPFPPARKLPARSIYDFDLINGFDCLLIGGGGLLAHPHDPLSDEDWCHRVHVPIVLMGVGAAPTVVAKHRPLLEKAWCVAGRDEFSLSALRAVRDDAFLLRDPILCAGRLDDLLAFDTILEPAPGATGLKEGAQQSDVLWVLKHASTESEHGLLRWIAEYIAGDTRSRHVIVAIEPALDQPLEAYFPGRVNYLSHLSDLLVLTKGTRRVVSMRFHGAIFAALCGKTSYGFTQIKISALYAECGVSGEYLTEPQRLRDLLGASEDDSPTRDSLDALLVDLKEGTKRIHQIIELIQAEGSAAGAQLREAALLRDLVRDEEAIERGPEL